MDKLFKNNLENRPWRKILSVFLSIIIAFSSFVSITFGNLKLSDYIKLGNMLTAYANDPDVSFYRYNELVGICKTDYTATGTIQYKIGENGEWTDYSIPFTVPAFQNTTVYARLGANGSPVFENFQTTSKALGVYTESCTDFDFSCNGISFGYTRTYNSADKNWFESIHSSVIVTGSVATVLLPDSTQLMLVKTGANTYTDELNGYVLTKSSSEYTLNTGEYIYHFAIHLLNSVAFISAIEDKNGNTLSLTRSYTTEQAAISDGKGRSFALSGYSVVPANNDPDVNYYSVREITDPNGNKLNYTRKLSRYIQVTDQAGVYLGKYQYANILTDATLIKSMDKTIAYNNNGRLSSITYDDGSYINYTYNDANMSYSTATSADEHTCTVYNDAFLPVSYTDEYGNTTTYTYDSHYRVATESCDGVTTTYTYDNMGNIISEVTTEEDGYNCYYTYDNNGNVIREHCGDSYTYYTYDSDGNNLVYATLKEDYEGTAPAVYDSSLTCFDTLVYTYDSYGRVLTETDSTGEVTAYTYDNYGNPLTETTTVTEEGITTTTTVTYTYDLLGNVTSTAEGNDTCTYIYDEAGRTLLVNDNGDCTRTLYDDLGRVIQEIAPQDYDSTCEGLPASNTYSDSDVGQRYVYNNNNQLVQETNRLDVVTDYTYYDTGEKHTESFDIYDYEYDLKGNLIKAYVNDVNTVSYTYNTDNQLTLESYANGQSVRHVYTEYGDNMLQYSRYRNNESEPFYEELYQNDELQGTFNYDSNMLSLIEDGTTYYYSLTDDIYHMVYSESVTEADEEHNVEAHKDITATCFDDDYTEVITENAVSYTYGNKVIEYSYSELQDTANIDTETIKCDNNNLFSSSYTYDSRDNVTEKSITTYGIDFCYQYDNENRIIVDGSGNDAKHYQYDNKGNLTRVDNNTVSSPYTATYSYDNRGNLESRNMYQFTQSNTPSNLVSERELVYQDYDILRAFFTTPSETMLIDYDDLGNAVSYGNKTLSWLDGRKLASVSEGNNTYSYTYDANGIRTSKTINSETTYYNIVGGTILAQSNSTETIIFQYNSFGKPFGFIYNGSQYYYITDNFGSILAVINSSGNILAAYSYDEWGKPIETNYTVSNNTTGGKAARANPLRYRGYYYDTETGYYYLQSRYYDPEIGRFINADTPEIAQQSKGEYAGLNLFAYCNNDPVNNEDPNGKKWHEIYKTSASINISVFVKVYVSKCQYVDTSFLILKKSKLAQFDNRTDAATKISWYNLFYQLACSIYETMQYFENGKGMKGRTRRGVCSELIIHYYAYKYGIKVKNTKQTEIGSTDNDYNAHWWERIALNHNEYNLLVSGNSNSVNRTVKKYKTHI